MAVELLPERQCHSCTAARKAEWGCEQDAQLPLKFDGEELFRCPRRPILEDPTWYAELFFLYRAYQKGFLPEEGSLGSQASKLIELFRVIDVTVEQCEEHKREKEARKRSRQNKGH